MFDSVAARERGADRLQLLSVQGAARLLGVSVSSLNRWRSLGGGPIFVRLGDGGRVGYMVADLLEYIEQRRCSSTSEYDHRFAA